MDDDTFGGGFLYHLEDNKVTLGFVIGLDYQNPTSAPSRRCSAGRPTRRSARTSKAASASATARAPSTTARRRPAQDWSSPAARWSAATPAPERRAHQGQPCRHQERHAGRRGHRPGAGRRPCAGRARDYPKAFEASWLHEELQQTRNFKLWFKKGKTVGQLMTGIEQWLLPKLGVQSPPWTLHNHKADHEA
jgi:electron-transferring-flavoprotein dehydrogenase